MLASVSSSAAGAHRQFHAITERVQVKTWQQRYPKENAHVGVARLQRYEELKRQWTAANQNATPAQYTAAMMRFCKQCGV